MPFGAAGCGSANPLVALRWKKGSGLGDGCRRGRFGSVGVSDCPGQVVGANLWAGRGYSSFQVQDWKVKTPGAVTW